MTKEEINKLDEFAKEAMKVLIEKHFPEKFVPEGWAIDAYVIAGEMMKARKKFLEGTGDIKVKKSAIPKNYKIVEVEQEEKDEENI